MGNITLNTQTVTPRLWAWIGSSLSVVLWKKATKSSLNLRREKNAWAPLLPSLRVKYAPSDAKAVRNTFLLSLTILSDYSKLTLPAIITTPFHITSMKKT